MNYNSIQEILDAGITNMTVLRNNTKQDDGTDTITGVDWFTFNGTVANVIYASGNSFLGFGNSSEHLKVNRRDGALYSLYREEGMLYNHYKFLKIRWVGYSAYNQITSAYALTYDVILWDTGDISLHMVTIPTSYNNGTYALTASNTYSYIVSNNSPDITFVKTDSGFRIDNNIINLQSPCEKRYLVRSGSTYYTVVDNVLSEITVDNLTSELFLNSGVATIPSYSLLSNLTSPEILYWTDNEYGALKNGLIVTGTPPLPQIVYYETMTIPDGQCIDKIELNSQYVLFAITFDGGQTWKYHNGEAWVEATSETEGMSETIMENLTFAQWAEVANSMTYQFRGVLTSIDSFVSKIYFNLAPLQIPQ